MSFEYELRLPSGKLSAHTSAELRAGVAALGGVEGRDGVVTLAQGAGSRAEDVSIHFQGGGALLVMESPLMLESSAVRALLDLGRDLGLVLYEEGDDVPLESHARSAAAVLVVDAATQSLVEIER